MRCELYRFAGGFDVGGTLEIEDAESCGESVAGAGRVDSFPPRRGDDIAENAAAGQAQLDHRHLGQALEVFNRHSQRLRLRLGHEQQLRTQALELAGHPGPAIFPQAGSRRQVNGQDAAVTADQLDRGHRR